ncbi:MAG: gamma-butyrobetaine hydroxylase-like domain-containing protein [Pseudomonadota bacterium]
MTTMPNLTDLKLHQASRKLEIHFDSGETFELSCEYLRVYSQSADVTGHAPGQEVLQVGKQDVSIDDITPVGNYAVKLHFSDGHNSGIYTWKRLYDLGKNQQDYWVDYLRRLMRAGHQHPELEKLKQQSR